MNQIVSQLKTLLNNNSTSFRNTLSALIVLALEAFIEQQQMFKCPPKRHEVYGCSFIFVPAFVLAILSVLVSDGFLEIIQGIWYRQLFPCRKTTPHFWTKFAEVAYNGIAVCSLWLFWAFLQGRYYVCAKMGNKADRLKKVKGNTTEIERIENLFLQAQTDSQIIGFVIILVSVAVPAVLYSFYHCHCKNSKLSIPNPEEYCEMETEKAVEEFKKRLQTLAKAEAAKKVKRFFPERSLRDVYNELKKEDGFKEQFKLDYNEAVAPNYKKAFDEMLEGEGTNAITGMLQADPKESATGSELMEHACYDMLSTYPRSGGDHSQPCLPCQIEGSQY